ncbi:hypothetical protein WJX72_002686 [[Myrmecia] bisecta]|uniref:Uncharacterized protein n=1 Tax=[Myrmecia] bisecta TaxID=41462 RepID=A0AAW1QEF7_9CHLO
MLSSSATPSPCTKSSSNYLGTSNSAVAVVEHGLAKVLPVNGKRTTPSIVAFKEDGRVLVGAEAKEQAATNPHNTFYSVKRLIGRRHEHCLLDGLAYSVQPGPDGRAVMECPVKGQTLAPEQVSAYLLRELVSHAKAYLREDVDGAVVTVPAYFDEDQRQATLRAASLAGLQKVQLLQEPVAAAMAYGLGKPFDADTILVFDLGGGTFDVSILDSFEGIVEVLATAGDAQLGGDDFDRAILGLLAQACMEQGGSDPRRSALAVQQLTNCAEQAKVALSSSSQTHIELPGSPGGAQLQVALTRAQFDGLTAHLRARLAPPLRQIARETFVRWVDEAAINGLSTPGPSAVAEPSAEAITSLSAPEAIQAGILMGQVQGLELMDGSYSWDLHQRATGFAGF